MFHIFPIRFASTARQPRTRWKCCVNVCWEVHRNWFHFHAIKIGKAISGLGHLSSRLSPLVIAMKKEGTLLEEAKRSITRLSEHMVGRSVFFCALEGVCCRSFAFFFFFFMFRASSDSEATLATRNCAVVFECVLCRVAIPFVMC